MSKLCAVLTTIQEPTECVRGLVSILKNFDAELIVIGDRKGPANYDLLSVDFYSVEKQLELPFRLARMLPLGHYSRKNLGYLIAFSKGGGCIYETDDDNVPLSTWQPREEQVMVEKTSARPWLNAYRLFTDELIWPRGFPLDRIRDKSTYRHDATGNLELVKAPIQQGLANGAPDVDAAWRLILDRPFDFDAGQSVWLPARTYCPFNSQTTWWWPASYQLMYLPSFCSFRMTDIWRSLIAQRCLWELECGLVFHSAEAFQLRNEHNLLRDFKDEIPGYLENERITSVLNDCSLLSGAENSGENLRRCYQALIAAGIFPPEELPLVDAWVEDAARF